MRNWDQVAAWVVLGGALLACSTTPKVIAWEPHSVRSDTDRIARRAVQVGPGDLDALRAAGGEPLGTMTMKGRDLASVTEAASWRAAERGGTHYMMGAWSETSSTTGYVGTNNGSTWTAVPVTSTASDARFVVIRVPKSRWGNLEHALLPIGMGEGGS